MGRACATCCLRRAARTIARVATTRRRTLSTAGAWFHLTGCLRTCGKPHRARGNVQRRGTVRTERKACAAGRAPARCGYNLTSYTGYLYEELLADSRHMPLLRQLDILVDGPFILEEKSLIIRFRGVAQPTYHRRAPLIGGRPRGAPTLLWIEQSLLRFREGFFMFGKPFGGARTSLLA